jgi:hypothetical protein
MFLTLKRALSIALVIGWASAALTAEPPALGAGSSSSELVPPPAATALPCTDNHCCIDSAPCNDWCRQSGVILDGDWHLLRPVINDNRAISVDAAAAGVQTDVRSFTYKFESDPSIRFGYRGECGLGFTVNWFHLNNSADPVNVKIGAGQVVQIFGPFGFAVGNPGTAVSLNNDIKMDIWDFDATQESRLGCFDLTFGAGVRYMHIAQETNANVTVPGVGIPALVVTTNTNTSFNGGGPSLILDGVRRFGNSGFGLYANARGGLLFGSKTENGSTTLPTGTTTTSSQDGTFGFGEIQLGVQWSRRYCGWNPFARIGFEGREYWGIGNSVNALSGNNSSNVGAYGLAVTAGLGW